MATTSLETLKERLYGLCIERLNDRLKELMEETEALQSAANEDTKSSMGDKYETSRAMAMIQKENLIKQQSAFVKMLQTLHGIKSHKNRNKVEQGSLIETDKGKYYLTVSLGQISVEDEKINVISPVSPIGQVMIGQKTGSVIEFRGQKFTILNLA
jgi:transcription elongation GreA/GreB family factor